MAGCRSGLMALSRATQIGARLGGALGLGLPRCCTGRRLGARLCVAEPGRQAGCV